MNVHGVGIDLVEIDELSAIVSRRGQRFLDRVFTVRELAYANAKQKPLIHLGARLAAKEAAFKALGTGWGNGVGFHDVEIVIEGWGTAPFLVVSGGFAERLSERGWEASKVSLTHSGHYASAVVLLGSDVPR